MHRLNDRVGDEAGVPRLRLPLSTSTTTSSTAGRGDRSTANAVSLPPVVVANQKTQVVLLLLKQKKGIYLNRYLKAFWLDVIVIFMPNWHDIFMH